MKGVERLLSCIDMSCSRVINPHPALGPDTNSLTVCRSLMT